MTKSMLNNRITEQDSSYSDLEKKSVAEILSEINAEDTKVPLAVAKAIPEIELLVTKIVERMLAGGRIFYIGAGTSGRLGVLDASEIPPTYGVSAGMVNGIIAGGDTALRNAVENAEDDMNAAWEDLKSKQLHKYDTIIGIAASGTTPYVIGGLRAARNQGLLTGAIVCNQDSPVAAEAEIAIELIVGPEYVTGSTRMKSGTAQKLVLNMISTATMIQLGRVKGNKMVNLKPTNLKLRNRAIRIICDSTGVDENRAMQLLELHGSAQKVIEVLAQQTNNQS
ncbi:MAG: N-acetylmuramic acid 6-phosphate etherase [Paludibacter sp.]